MANILNTAKRAAVVAALVEGNSIRATVRMTGAAKNTVTKLLCDLGEACSRYQDEVMVNLPCKRLQVDEIWSFCQMKQKTANIKGLGGEFGVGDVWTFTAIDPKSKLIPSWMVGTRTTATATVFMKDLASRLSNRIQLSTDGHKMYLEAVEEAFGADIDFAQVIKHFGTDPEGEKRYSPAKCIGVEKHVIQGCPDPEHITTSHNERNNLSIRMGMRRFTRLTNAFSKKAENLAHAVSLHFMVYNFVKPHGTLTKEAKGKPTTPAMVAGITDKPWTYEDVIGLLG